MEEAGAALIGGHSAEGAELALGFAVTGRTRPRREKGRVLRKGGLRPGDRLVLTKPLGTGVILAAEMRGRAPARSLCGGARGDAAIRRRPRRRASSSHGATACTDVTGFGLLGHLIEMLTASGMAARLDPEAIPALDGALDLLAGGLTSSLHGGNAAALAALAPEEADADPAFAALLIDPQTAGGLLAGIPAERADDCLAELIALGYRAAFDRRRRPRAPAALRWSRSKRGARRVRSPSRSRQPANERAIGHGSRPPRRSALGRSRAAARPRPPR